MNNLPIESKKKKLNILQKLRLALFRTQKFTMEKYISAPEYIKTDDRVIGKIINNADICIEENLLQIPEYKLLEEFNSDIIKKFSLEKQIEFIKAKGEWIYYYTTEDLLTLIDEALKIGQSDFLRYSTRK